MSRVWLCLRGWLWLPLLAVSLAMVAWGLRRGEFAVVTNWFNQLCMACIGLTGR